MGTHLRPDPGEVRILLVEDTPEDACLLAALLENAKGGRFRLETVGRLSAALDRLGGGGIDAVLLDLNLPDAYGLDTFERLQAHSPALPILVLTAVADETIADQAIRQGAQDYLLKGQLDSGLVVRAIRYAIERKRAENALRTTEERFELMARATNDAVWDWDLVTNRIWWNVGVRSFLGYPPDHVGTDLQWWHEHIHPEDRERVVSCIRSVIDGGGRFWLDEYRYLCADGSYACVFDRGYVIHDERGKPVRMIGAMMDITDRKRAEEALRETNETLRTLIQASPLGIAVTDADQKLRVWNAAAERIFGWRAHEVLGRPLPALAPPGRPDDLGSLIERVLRGESLTGEEFPVVRRDGAPVHLSVSMAPLRDALANSRGAMAVVADVTQRKRAEEEREALQRLSQGLSRAANARDVGREVAEVCRSLFRHDAFTLDLGDETGGRTETIHAEDTAPGQSEPQELPPQSAPQEALANNPALRGEAKLINRIEEPAGTELQPFGFTERLSRSLMFAPVRWQGTVIGFISAQSYTPGRYTEADLKLLQMVADECGGALARLQVQEALRASEEQLRQSQKMEAVGRLAGGVAHDFNNLMTAISGYAELLRGRFPPGDPNRVKAEEILKASNRAAALTRQLLAFSRRQVLQPKVLDLNGVVRGVESLLHGLIGEPIEFRAVLDPSLGSVQADQGQIEQVLMNLAVNARDAMPAGGALTIETRNIDLGADYSEAHGRVRRGPHVLLAVSDTGCGMSPEVQSHLFEPFYTTKEKGTGLGLATVYGIVKQSGGDIWAYSEPGRGSTFRIYLPRVDAPAEPRKGDSTRIVPRRGTETVLLAEDAEVVRRLLRELLVQNGYKLLEAKEGEEALRISREYKGPIHLLVTDMVMPRMSGRELATRLAPERPEMKVLYMSGYTEEAIARHGVLDPGTAFLEKPFAPEALARKVRELLDEGPPPRRAAGVSAREGPQPR